MLQPETCINKQLHDRICHTDLTFAFHFLKEQRPVPNGLVADGQYLGQGARKKSKFVPLYSQHGKEKLVIKLPGSIRQRSRSYCLFAPETDSEADQGTFTIVV